MVQAMPPYFCVRNLSLWYSMFFKCSLCSALSDLITLLLCNVLTIFTGEAGTLTNLPNYGSWIWSKSGIESCVFYLPLFLKLSYMRFISFFLKFGCALSYLTISKCPFYFGVPFIKPVAFDKFCSSNNCSREFSLPFYYLSDAFSLDSDELY